MTTNKMKRSAKPTNSPELPEWVAFSPDIDFQLAVFAQSDSVEFISLSREEYMDLKATLARMRGYTIAKAA
jgi:hypothetical protein